MKLTTKILIGMGLGAVIGLILNWISGVWGTESWAQEMSIILVDGVFDSVGRIFVNALKLMVVPVVLFSLTCGTASMGTEAGMGKMALRTVLFYLMTTAIAITLALSVANITNPGVGVDLASMDTIELKGAPSIKDTLINMVPSNPVSALTGGNMLQVIVLCVLLGLAFSMSGPAGKKALEVMESFNEVILKLVTIIMHIAPYGVFCLLAKVCAQLGLDAILKVGVYFFTVTLVLALHAFGVFSVLLKLIGKLNPITFFKNVRPAMLYGFSTSSSAATMPITMNVVERRVGVDNKVASLTIPIGTTINMDGTAIMQGVATVFIAQAYGIDMTLQGYLMVIFTATLASVGTAAVPGVGLVMLTMVLQQAGLPVEGIGLIIGVDRLLDMMRTAVNITGDCAVTTIVAKQHDLLDKDIFNEVSDADEYDTQKAGA